MTYLPTGELRRPVTLYLSHFPARYENGQPWKCKIEIYMVRKYGGYHYWRFFSYMESMHTAVVTETSNWAPHLNPSQPPHKKEWKNRYVTILMTIRPEPRGRCGRLAEDVQQVLHDCLAAHLCPDAVPAAIKVRKYIRLLRSRLRPWSEGLRAENKGLFCALIGSNWKKEFVIP